jgi:hypothetical protein
MRVATDYFAIHLDDLFAPDDATYKCYNDYIRGVGAGLILRRVVLWHDSFGVIGRRAFFWQDSKKLEFGVVERDTRFAVALFVLGSFTFSCCIFFSTHSIQGVRYIGSSASRLLRGICTYI